MTHSSDAIEKFITPPVHGTGTGVNVKMKHLCNQWHLMILLFVIREGVLVLAEACSKTQVLECYGDVTDSVSDVFDQRTLNMSHLGNLCKERDTVQRCEEDLAHCIDSDPSLKAIQIQYTTIRRESCGNSSFDLSKMENKDDPVNNDSHEKKCWYRQLKRCLERQINRIRSRMTRYTAKAMVPHEFYYGAVCRLKREVCHQVSKIDVCPPFLQDAIRRMEDSMNNAQQLLCKDDHALLKNLLLSYKFWDIKHFARCSTNAKMLYITENLFATRRLQSECREIRSRMFRCLKESYSSIADAQPKPDVDGATKVLAAFLDRMLCVDALNLSDSNSNSRDHRPLRENNGYTAGQPVVAGTTASSFLNLTASEQLQGGAASLEILAYAPVAVVSVCFLSRQFLE